MLIMESDNLIMCLYTVRDQRKCRSVWTFETWIFFSFCKWTVNKVWTKTIKSLDLWEIKMIFHRFQVLIIQHRFLLIFFLFFQVLQKLYAFVDSCINSLIHLDSKRVLFLSICICSVILGSTGGELCSFSCSWREARFPAVVQEKQL